jgi:NADP-reducing hydrogenase subunit HndB
MAKIKSLDELRKLKDNLQAKFNSQEKGGIQHSQIQIKVAMATCGIASGAKTVMEFMVNELEKRGIESVITQTGCMGYCYAEPTIEVKLPNQEPVVFGYVDTKKADEIIEKYIKNGELVDGIIPMNYETIDKK